MRTEPRPAPMAGQPQPPRTPRRAAPLPRAPFGIADELSCYYDAPAEPCNVHIEVRVPGHLDEPGLRLAAAGALAEQPRALIRRAPGTGWRLRYRWEAPERPDLDPLSSAAWADEAELAQRRRRFLAASPPLDRSPPFRLLLAAGPDEDCLILNAHHAALDGISCLDLLRRIARHYPGAAGPATTGPATTGPATTGPATAGMAEPARPAGGPAPPPAGRPAHPDAGARPTGTAGARPGLLPRPAVRIAADLTVPPTAMPARHDRRGYGFQLITCDRVPAMRRDARGPHATVNDVLITALIVAIGRWNAAHGRPAGPVRITMPVNARMPGQAGAAGNLSRLTAVTAWPAPGEDPRTLAAVVAAQTLAAKNRPGPQVDPVGRALATPWCPVAVKRRLLRLGLRTAGPLVCDTSLVSNLGVVGDPPRFGGVPATHMWFSTSAHMPRGLSVGAITLDGRLHLCLRYRRALFSEPAAARFADAYAAALGDMTSPGGQRDRQH